MQEYSLSTCLNLGHSGEVVGRGSFADIKWPGCASVAKWTLVQHGVFPKQARDLTRVFPASLAPGVRGRQAPAGLRAGAPPARLPPGLGARLLSGPARSS